MLIFGTARAPGRVVLRARGPSFGFLFALALVAFAFVGLVSFAALAQGPADQPPDLTILLQQLAGVLGDYKTGGLLVALIGFSNLATNLLKVPFIKDKLNIKPWMLPVASAVIAFLGSFASALRGGSPGLNALISGVMAAFTVGLGGAGLHELVQSFSPGKQAERAAGAVIHDAIVKGDEDAAAHVADNYAALQEIAKLPTEKDRTAALAEWAKAHPPQMGLA